MDYGLDSLVSKVFLQCVALLAQHGEDVEDIVLRVFPGGHGQLRIVHLFYISLGYLTPATVVGIQMAQLHVEHGCLNLVETTGGMPRQGACRRGLSLHRRQVHRDSFLDRNCGRLLGMIDD